MLISLTPSFISVASLCYATEVQIISKEHNMRKIIYLALLSFFSCTALAADPDYKILSKKNLPDESGFFQVIQFNTTPDNSVTLYAATINQNYRATFHRQKESIQFFANYLDELSRQHDFIIGINGGYYEPSFIPVGLYIEQGKVIKPISHNNALLKACITLNKNQKIKLETNLENCLNADYAMQIGPLIIDHGQINPRLQATPERSKFMQKFLAPHRRTLLAFTSENKLVVITTSSATLFDLANFLQKHAAIFDAGKLTMVVNLDGGSSTGMFVRLDEAPFYYHEIHHVKTLIFISGNKL